MNRFLARQPLLLQWRAPEAGPVALPRLRDRPADAFCEDVRRRADVLLLPSSVFDFGNRHLRFGLGRLGVPEGLEALERYLASG